MNNTNNEIINAIDVAKRAQRNYDLTKSIPQKDLETLIYVASNSPSKQNETHFNLRVYTDPVVIKEIYDRSKNFTFQTNKETDKIFTDKAKDNLHKSDKRYAVENSQIRASAVFVFCDDQKNLRGGTHIIAARSDKASPIAKETLFEQKAMSIGISSGQLTMSAALLGYKTGFCSAFEKGANNPDSIENLLSCLTEPRLLVGVGYPNENLERKVHPYVYNRDIKVKEAKKGLPDENWVFPSMIDEDIIKKYWYNFEKIDVWVNDERYEQDWEVFKKKMANGSGNGKA
jgi:nitroreductase